MEPKIVATLSEQLVNHVINIEGVPDISYKIAALRSAADTIQNTIMMEHQKAWMVKMLTDKPPEGK